MSTAVKALEALPKPKPWAARLPASAWDAFWADFSRGSRLVSAEERHIAYDAAGIAPGQTAIDLGCGMGQWTRQLSQWGLDVTGYDFSIEALAAASRHVSSKGVEFEHWDIDVEEAPRSLRPGTVDLITCRLSLPYLDRVRLLNDVHRWLVPGGRFYALVRVEAEGERESADPFTRGLTDEQIANLGTVGWASRETFRLYDKVGIVLTAPLMDPLGGDVR